MRAFWASSRRLMSSDAQHPASRFHRRCRAAIDAVIAPLAIGARSDSDSFDAGKQSCFARRASAALPPHLSVTVNVAAAADELTRLA